MLFLLVVLDISAIHKDANFMLPW